MEYTVVHQGVPLGTVDPAENELCSGCFLPRPPYESLRDIVRAGSEALAVLGFFGAAADKASTLKAEPEALPRVAALRFDLHDPRGQLVPADFVNLIQAPDGTVLVIARLRGAHAPSPARQRSPVRVGTDESRPDA